MADCKFCGKDAGLGWESHSECAKAMASATASPPLTAKGVFWAVFLALCAFGLLASIISLMARC